MLIPSTSVLAARANDALTPLRRAQANVTLILTAIEMPSAYSLLSASIGDSREARIAG